MLVGRTTIGATAQEFATDTKRVSHFTSPPKAIRLPKLSVYLDGQGSGGVGSAYARAVAYVSDALIGESAEVEVVTGQAAGWVDFLFDVEGGGLLIPASAALDLGLHVGGTTNRIRIRTDALTAGGRTNADTYVGGAASTFGASTTLNTVATVYASYFVPWVPPEGVDDFYAARLPFAESQRMLAGSPYPKSRIQGRAGWHGTITDPIEGAHAIVREGGVFEHMLGERIVVTYQRRGVTEKVAAYVHNRMGLIEDDSDLSLSRDLFARIAPLSEDSINVTAEVIL